jgi:4-amino-4-deoxy-L-arabinose transferase-like glycosyltransferase
MATTTAPPPATTLSRRRLSRPRVLRRAADEPMWVRPSLAAVLAAAAALCLWNLSISGTSNEYYAAAVKAASVDWKAWFFGSLDPGSFITVDKPPLSLWMMGLSARIFGFSSWSMLLPGALCTIAAVALLYATVKRAFGPAAGIAAAFALATTPITVAIARVNNPDALLVLLLVAAAYFTQKAIANGRTRPLLVAGAIVGLAFMTKMLEGWMVVPALGAAYLVAGPPRLRVRLAQLAAAFATMVAVSAAWPVAVSLWPGSEPYVGGSTDGTVWNLIFGYNGFGRLTGSENGVGGGGGASFGGAAGPWRMFNAEVGGQIAWLLPLAGVSLVAGLWLTRRAPRTDVRRAGLVLFGVWAVVLVAVFSGQQGIFHPYYVSALAPAVAALAGVGVVLLAQSARRSWLGAAVLAATIGGTAWLAVSLLGQTADFAPWLRAAIPVAAGLAVLGIVAVRSGGGRRVLAATALAAAFALAAGPASYAVANLGHALNGDNVLAGPSSVGGGGGMGRGPGGPGGGGRAMPPGASSSAIPTSGATPSATAASTASAPRGAGGGGGRGGAVSVSADLISYLEANQGTAKYLVAAGSSHTTAPIIVSTGKAVVTIGGFSGQDPTPTVSQLATMVADGQLKYVLISSGGGGGPGGGAASSALTTWVKAHGTVVTAVSTSAVTLYAVSA